MEYQEVGQWSGLTLILVPHQDDEILLAAGIINECCHQKKAIAVCFVTNGDYLAKDRSKGTQRLQESINACRLLGLNKDMLFTLGYADTGMSRTDSFLSKLYYDEQATIFSSSVGCSTYGIPNVLDDYSYKCTNEHSEYTRSSLKRDLSLLINNLSPKRIFTTSRFDVHGDHYALALFLDELKLDNIEIYEGLVHSFEGDQTWPARFNGTTIDSLNEPTGFKKITGMLWDDRIIINVPDKMAIPTKGNLKYQALLCFKSAFSEQEASTRSYLSSFIKKDEVFLRNK